MEQVLHGQTAIVTGAGSPAGIGFAVARSLLGAGTQVAITATTEGIYERARELDATGVTGGFLHHPAIPGCGWWQHPAGK
jgi:NAD(P)-dependent dehydrogenase (short-subunit alcohol dehydrogenase family)